MLYNIKINLLGTKIVITIALVILNTIFLP